MGYVRFVHPAHDNEYVLTGYRRPGGPLPPAKGGVGTPYQHDTFAKCWKSVWAYWHNETVNIHTHLAGGVFAAAVLVWQLLDFLGIMPHGPWSAWSMQRFPATDLLVPQMFAGVRMRVDGVMRAPDPTDRVVFAVFFFAAMTCLLCSATFHTVNCHSHAVRVRR